MTEEMPQARTWGAFPGRLPLGRSAVGRWAEPADIAGVVAILASDDARFLDG